MFNLDPNAIFTNGWGQTHEDDFMDTGFVGSRGWSKNRRKEDVWTNFSNIPGNFYQELPPYDDEPEP